MKIYATYNIKGGVGKTTTAVNLAYLAAGDGLRTVLWDLDPQGAASFMFRVKPKVKGGGQAIIKGDRTLDDAIKGTDFDGLDLIPADFTYRNMDLFLDKGPQAKQNRKLARLLAPLADEYDAVFLDCPPSISLVSENVLHAADVIVVPLIPTTLSVRTLEQLTDFIGEFHGQRPEVLAFFSMVDRRKKLHREITEELQAKRDDVAHALVPSAAIIEKMAVERSPVTSFAPASAAARAYKDLWAEVRALGLSLPCRCAREALQGGGRVLRDEWREVRIADLGRVVTGATPRAADAGAWGDAVDFITPGDQRPGARDATPARRLSEAGARRLASRLVPAGTTLVTCIGATIGKTSLTVRPAVTNQQVNAVVPDEATVTREFLYYLLTARAGRIAQAASGSAAQIVTKRQFERLPVLIPPRPEQERITGLLGALDDKIAANRRTARTALELAGALYDRLLRDAPSVPHRLGDLADLRYGKALPAARRRPGPVPVYGSGGVVGAHDLALVRGPGIIVGRKGTAGAVHWSQRDFFPIDTVFYVAAGADAVPLEFLFFALRRLGLAAMRSDSAVPGLSRASALTSRVLVPGASVLRDFQRDVRNLFALRDSLALQSATLATLRDTRLSSVFQLPVPLRHDGPDLIGAQA